MEGVDSNPLEISENRECIREASNLSQEQGHYATGISQSQIAQIEAGNINTGINRVSIIADMFWPRRL